MTTHSIRVAIAFTGSLAIASGFGGAANGAPTGYSHIHAMQVRSSAPFNAVATVTAWRKHHRLKLWQQLKRWHGQVAWRGPGGRFVGDVRNGVIQWGRDKLDTLQIDTDRDGKGGIALRRWLPKRATRVIVTIKSGYGVGAGTGAGDRQQASSAGADETPDSDTSRARGRAGRGQGRGRAGRGHSRGAGSGERDGVGSGDGQRGGSAEGERGGATESGGGVRDAYGPSIRGQKFGDREGAVGGTGARGDAGARGGLALFGVLNIPRGWRAAVELALIAGQELTPSAAFKQVLGRGVRKLSVVGVRHQIRHRANRFANAEVRRIRRRFSRQLRAMDATERDFLLRATWQHKQRQYFDLVERGAHARRVRAERKLSKQPRNKRLRARRNEARKVEDAAAVKPVESALPRNHKYAGRLYRIDPRQNPEAVRIIQSKGRAGVRFTRQGFPDFTPWTYREGRVLADVRIQYKRKRKADFRAARDEMRARLGDPHWNKPRGYTWHHHEDVGRMILVPIRLHRGVSHTGGVSHYRMLTGDYHAY